MHSVKPRRGICRERERVRERESERERVREREIASLDRWSVPSVHLP